MVWRMRSAAPMTRGLCCGGCRRGVALLGDSVEGPAANVVERVLAGVESLGVGDQVDDRFGFDLPDAAAVDAATVLMQDVMRPLVSQRLDALGVVDVVADHHEPAAEVEVAVRADAAGAAAHLEAAVLEEPLEPVSQARGCLPGE